MSNLYQNSIEILLKYQDPGGAYLACPNFSTYQYAWLRDGSFCAYALDLAGETHSADRFHAWVLSVLHRYQNKLAYCLHQIQAGVLPPASECLHSRFTVEGLEVPGNWGHHQLDGLGTWLWAYGQHLRQSADPSVAPKDIVILKLVRDYLSAFWHYPCSDCWEEHEDQIHPHSLGAVYAGLESLGGLLGDPQARASADEVRTFLLKKAVVDGRWIKSVNAGPAVDANLIFLATPYHVLPLEDARTVATLEAIQSTLTGPEGGVRRYAADSYYGGGEWVLLSASLGWAACEAGNLELARRQLTWVEAQANPQGELPEQVPEHLNDPSYYPVWTQRWGPIATPLLWSHAQYIILWNALQQAEKRSARA